MNCIQGIAVALIGLGILTVACDSAALPHRERALTGVPTATVHPAADPSPSDQPADAAGSRDWDLAVDGARWEMSLEDGSCEPAVQGFIFLVVDVTFRNLDSAVDTQLRIREAVLYIDNLPLHDDIEMLNPEGSGYRIGSDGSIRRAEGAGSGNHFLLDSRAKFDFSERRSQQISLLYMIRLITHVNLPHNYRIVFNDVPPVWFTPEAWAGSCAPNCNIDEKDWWCFNQKCVLRDCAPDCAEGEGVPE